MILDSDIQKGLLISIIEQVNFPGKLLAEAHALKVAVESAGIEAAPDFKRPSQSVSPKVVKSSK